jgi:hypothetical protein
MAFPTSPTNGQQAIVNGILYTYASANQSWTIVPGTVGNLTIAGNVSANNFIITGTGIFYSNGTAYSAGGGVTSVSGTTDQITASPTTGNVVLSLPSTVAIQTLNAATIGNTGAAVIGDTGVFATKITASNLAVGAINANGAVTVASLASNGAVSGTAATFTTINVSSTTANAITANFTHGSDQNFQLTSQNGSSVNGTGEEVARFGINYLGTGWDSFTRYIRGSAAQNGSQVLFAGNTGVFTVSSTGVLATGTITATGTATVNALTSNGAVTGTTGTFTTSTTTSALNTGTLNANSTATVNSLVSNGAVSGTTGTFSSGVVTTTVNANSNVTAAGLTVNANATITTNITASSYIISGSGVFWSNGTAYSTGGGGGGGTAFNTYTANTIPPTSGNVNGDQWYDTSNDVLYEYQTDGVTSYWFDITGPIVAANGTTTGTTTTSLDPFLLMGA